MSEDKVDNLQHKSNIFISVMIYSEKGRSVNLDFKIQCK